MKTIVHQPRQMEQSQKDVLIVLLSTYVLNRKMKKLLSGLNLGLMVGGKHVKG